MDRLVTLEKAWEIIQDLRDKYYYSRDVESAKVDLPLLGRDLAGDIVAPEDSPPHDIASYDGYAMRSDDAERYPLRLAGGVYAGDIYESLRGVREGEAVYIATGAFLPPGSDCVLRLEDARVEGGMLYGIPVTKGTKVVPRGSNYRKGEVVLRGKCKVRPQEYGILRGLGIEEVEVYRRPQVGVLATGSEIAGGLLRDVNSHVSMAFMENWGCKTNYLGAVRDEYEEIRDSILKAAKNFDCVVTSGGVSVGRKDYVLRALEELGDVILYKVKTRPGKPFAVGVVGGTPIFALPGKPAGALVATILHLRRYFLGIEREPHVKARITEDILLSRRDTDSPDMANLVFVSLENGKAKPVGFEGGVMPLIKRGGRYNVSAIAANLRSALVDGYAIVGQDTGEGEEIKVHLFT
jgi:molybdopterin molybdotransferase